jgi:hypothetical protein
MLVKRFAIIFASVLLGTAAFAAAASACTTYTGPSGGNWGTAAYWSTDVVPSSTDDVCITGATEVVFTPYVSGGQQIYADTVNSITIGAQATLEIEGESSSYGADYYQESDLKANNSVTVDSGGTLLLDSTATNVAGGGVPAGATSGGQARLYVANDPASGTSPALINNGTITGETDPGTTFGEFIQGPIQNAGSVADSSGTLTLQDANGLASANSGTMTIAAGAATMLTGGPGFTNSGQIAATGSLTLTSLTPQTWTESGGSVTGSTVSLYDGDTLDYSSGTGSFAFGSGGAQNSLSGTIPAGQTVTLTAGPGGGNAGISFDGTVTNNGTFTMNALAGANGNPEVDTGPSGGTLVNNGTVNTLDATTAQSNLFRANLTNDSAGVIDVQSGTTYFDGGNTMINGGSLVIAPGAQFIQKAGTATNTGTLSPQIASATDFGQYNLYGGTFNAGGSLTPVLVGGYVPTAGQEFEVVNIGDTDTFTGTFANVGNGFTADNAHAHDLPGDVGVVYGEKAPSGPAAGTVHVGKTKIVGGKLVTTLSCPAGDSCAKYTVTATVTEHLKGKNLIELTAVNKKKSKTTTKVTTIATAKGTVAGGKTVTVTLSLNKTGAALLKRYGKLKTLVTVTAGGKTVSKTTITLTEPKPAHTKK